MKKIPALLASLFGLAVAAQAAPVTLQIEATGTPELTLRGSAARQQLLVTGTLSDGMLRDFTHRATYTAAPAGIVKVDAARPAHAGRGWRGRPSPPRPTACARLSP